MIEQGWKAGQTLTPYATAKLMEDLGIGHYLTSPSCDSHMWPYNSSVNGWTSGQCDRLYPCYEDFR